MVYFYFENSQITRYTDSLFLIFILYFRNIIVFIVFCVDYIICPESRDLKSQEYEPKFGITHDGTPVLKQLFLLPDESPGLNRKFEISSTTESPESGEVVWQLFSHCSKGFLQLDKTVNARGSSSNPCSSNKFCFSFLITLIFSEFYYPSKGSWFCCSPAPSDKEICMFQSTETNHNAGE